MWWWSVGLLAWPFRRLAEAEQVAANDAMDADVRSLEAEVERLRHEVLLAERRAEAAERRVELLDSAHEANMKVLDRIVVVHGVHAGQR